MRLALLFTLLSLGASAQVPPRVGYQGRLLNADGTPATGTPAFRFSVYDAPVSGNVLWTERQTLGLSDGFYATQLGLGSDGGFTPSVLNGQELWLEVSVNGEVLSPRQPVGSVPYAMVCGEAKSVAGVAGCQPGQVLSWNGTAWSCASTASYGAGAGLALAGDTFSIASGGVSNAMLASSAVTITAGTGLSGGGAVPLGGTVALDNTGVTALAGGGGVTASAASGAVTLGTAAGGDLSGPLSAALVLRLNGVPVASVMPLDGEVLRFNGSTGQWAPAAAAGITAVGASSPLSSSGGSSPNISLSGTVPVGSGGTGITDAPTAAGQYLRSSGTEWSVGSIAPADLPAGSDSYIQNQGAAPQVASFDISGTGAVANLTVSGQAAVGYPDAGTAAMAVNGAVGIGTNAPVAPLEVRGRISSTVIGAFCGATTATYTGATVGGYAGAKQKCEVACGHPNAHMCTVHEYIISRQLGLTLPGNGAWISGVYSQTAPTGDDDCDAWGATGEYAGVWGWSSGGQDLNFAPCTSLFRIACCL